MEKGAHDATMPASLPTHAHLRHQVIAEKNPPFFGADLDAVLNVEPQPLERRVEVSPSVYRHCCCSVSQATLSLRQAANLQTCFWREALSEASCTPPRSPEAALTQLSAEMKSLRQSTLNPTLRGTPIALGVATTAVSGVWSLVFGARSGARLHTRRI